MIYAILFLKWWVVKWLQHRRGNKNLFLHVKKVKWKQAAAQNKCCLFCRMKCTCFTGSSCTFNLIKSLSGKGLMIIRKSIEDTCLHVPLLRGWDKAPGICQRKWDWECHKWQTNPSKLMQEIHLQKFMLVLRIQPWVSNNYWQFWWGP